MDFISAFDVLGPNMIGPSSSHTAGAAVIGHLAYTMLGEPVKEAKITFYGSFARTYNGHGTARAILGGLMGFATDDVRIRDSFEIAGKNGVKFEFIPDEEKKDIYPNTADIHMVGESGKTMDVRGESIGGGKVKIVRINTVDLEFTGEYSTLIVTQQDVPGVVAHITQTLSAKGVNIAFMRLYREARGDKAFTIVESDENLPESVIEVLKWNSNIHDVMLIQK